jgi:hypothetical protein
MQLSRCLLLATGAVAAVGDLDDFAALNAAGAFGDGVGPADYFSYFESKYFRFHKDIRYYGKLL